MIFQDHIFAVDVRTKVADMPGYPTRKDPFGGPQTRTKAVITTGLYFDKGASCCGHLRSHLCLFKLSAEARMVEYLKWGCYSLANQRLLKD